MIDDNNVELWRHIGNQFFQGGRRGWRRREIRLPPPRRSLLPFYVRRSARERCQVTMQVQKPAYTLGRCRILGVRRASKCDRKLSPEVAQKPPRAPVILRTGRWQLWRDKQNTRCRAHAEYLWGHKSGTPVAPPNPTHAISISVDCIHQNGSLKNAAAFQALFSCSVCLPGCSRSNSSSR